MTGKVVILGAGAVGMTVATYLKRHTGHEVTVFTSDTHTAYSQCGMPFVLEGVIHDFPDLIVRPPETFIDMGIDLHMETTVNDIDATGQKVISDAGIFGYDHLVIATGSTPFVPAIKGRELDSVFTLHTLSDGMRINLSINEGSRITIIGAGGIGTELAACLAVRGIAVTLVEALPQVLPMTLDPDMALSVQQHLTSLGVRVITGAHVHSINGRYHVRSVSVQGGSVMAGTVPTDIVIMATGLGPLSGIARNAGYRIGSTGGIVTDEHMRVSTDDGILENVYAGGECAEVKEFVTGSPFISRLGSAARRMARVIGENIAGQDAVYLPTLSPNVVVAGEVTAGSAGITSHTAGLNDITVVGGVSEGRTRAGYYPGGSQLTVKLIFSNRRLVGAQVVAGEGVKERIDALSLAIRMGATVDDLLEWETAYAPPVSTVIDPVTFAADDAKMKMEG
ncbi:MAG: FAD-dependent oxidoreductase [ANME-2 cluster archaeon]|nr:FAD-dependent oxidoreductase [ANME-2 cluster archaeon]